MSCDAEDYFPQSPHPNRKSKEVCYVLHEASNAVGYIDFIDRFSKTSSSVNKCLLVGHNYDRN